MSTGSEPAKLYGAYKSGMFELTIFMCFEKVSDHLSRVRLKLNTPGNGDLLVNALSNKYGEPLQHVKSTAAEGFVWRTATDQISVMAIGIDWPKADVSLDYTPRFTESHKGL